MAHLGRAMLLAAGILSAQPKFEAVSIHTAPPFTIGVRTEGLRSGVGIEPTRAEFGRRSIRDLICLAYGVRSLQISGPEWIPSTLFNIVATLPAGASPAQVPEMLQAMLADRFRLALHRDSHDFSVYALLPGKGELKLTPRPASFDPATRTFVRPQTMEDLVGFLSSGLSRPVVDQTGLKGEFMLSYEDIAGDFNRRRLAEHPESFSGRMAEVAESYTGGDVFQIIESWGLKLEPRKIPLPVLIIDHVEKTPTAN